MTYNLSPAMNERPFRRQNQEIVLRETQRWREMLFYAAAVTTLSYFLRDAFTAAVRYYLDAVGLGVLWFIPDMLGFGVTGLFVLVVCIREKDLLAIFFMCSVAFSTLVAVFYFDGYLVSISSGVKMFLPVLVGIGFRGRSLFEMRGVKLLYLIGFLATTIAIAINPYIDYPWLGFETTNAFGVTREAQRLWWTGGVIRYGGLAGDSTMAAFVTLFTYIMVSRYTGILFNLLCWPLVGWALHTTTSKTSLGLFGVYVVIYIVLKISPERYRLRVARRLALASFISLLIPPLFLILLGGTDLTSVSADLGSLADRINNTWFGPFPIISDIFPVGLFVGCGLGCYAYPQLYYDPLVPYYLPLDNFYLTTSLEMGYPFLIFVAFLVFRTKSMRDPMKLLLLLTWNIWAITVQGYGPSYATLIFGYSISEMFAPRQRSLKRPLKKRLHESRTSRFAKTGEGTELIPHSVKGG